MATTFAFLFKKRERLRHIQTVVTVSITTVGVLVYSRNPIAHPLSLSLSSNSVYAPMTQMQRAASSTYHEQCPSVRLQFDLEQIKRRWLKFNSMAQREAAQGGDTSSTSTSTDNHTGELFVCLLFKLITKCYCPFTDGVLGSSVSRNCKQTDVHHKFVYLHLDPIEKYLLALGLPFPLNTPSRQFTWVENTQAHNAIKTYHDLLA